MNYEVKDVKPVALPYTKDNVYGVQLIITTGIVGQIHPGFVNIESNTDTFCPILRTDGTDAAEEKFAEFAAEYVANKYPNVA
jgi:hypothetical protein